MLIECLKRYDLRYDICQEGIYCRKIVYVGFEDAHMSSCKKLHFDPSHQLVVIKELSL